MSAEFPNPQEADMVRRLGRLNSLLRERGVGFDVDGVTADTYSRGVAELNRQFHTRYKLSDVKSFMTIIGWLRRCSPVNPQTAVMELFQRDSVISEAPPMPGAVILNRFLQWERVGTFHITARPGITRAKTLAWFAAYMPWIPPDRVRIQDDGNEINPAYKQSMIKKLGIGVFFEDSAEEAVQIARSTDALVVLVPRPWNIKYKKHERIVRPEGYEGLPLLINCYLSLADTLLGKI